MADSSTSMIEGINHDPFIQGIENGVRHATGLSQGWADMIVAISIVVLAYLLTKAAKYFIKDVAPLLVSKTQTTLDDHILKAVNGPLQVFIFTVGIYLACATLDEMPGVVSNNLATALTIVLIFIAAYLISNVTSAIINWYKEDIAPKTDSELDDSLMSFLGKTVWVLVFILATLMALAILHIDISPLVATLGVGGIAVALAAQELLSNLFGAFAVLSDRPYKIGDRIELSSGRVGDVVDIGLRSTRIKTLDNRLIVVPNSDISKSNIINYSLPDTKICYDIKVGIAYDADVEKASAVLKDIAARTEGVLADPAPRVYIKDLGNFSVNLVMQVWMKDYKLNWDVPDHIYRETLKRFAAEKIEIPYPIQSVILSRPEIAVESVTPPLKR